MILILGAGGMLGHQLWLQLGDTLDVIGTLRAAGTLRAPSEGLRRMQTARRVLRTGIDAADLDSIESLLVELQPGIVINCIGVIKQVPQGQDPEACIRLNSLFPHQLNRLCARRGIRLIHISTDCVFSGSRGGYLETDPPDATDWYGRSKALGEVVDGCALTLRTSIIGHETKSRFSLLEWFLSQSDEVNGFAGVRWNGVTTVELARVIRDFVLPHGELTGLFQVAAQALSKAELLHRIAAVYGHPLTIQSRPEPINDMTLDGSHFRQATGWQAPTWERMLTDMRDEWRRHAACYEV